MALLRDFQSAARRSGTPLCIALIVISAINLLVSFVYQEEPWNRYLVFLASLAGSQPWSFLTYPISISGAQGSGAFISVVFSGMWLYSIGASVERDLGTPKFAAFWVVMSIVPAFVLIAALYIVKQEIPLAFMFLPLAGVTVAWATRHPNETVSLFMIIPIAAKYLAWITVGIVLFGYGVGGHPMLGVFACLHLALAWAFAANKIPGVEYGKAVFTRKREGWKPVERNDAYFADVKKREIERAERERLRKLLGGSIADDPEDKR